MMNDDLRVFGPRGFDAFSQQQAAAFTAYCVALIDKHLGWLAAMRGTEMLPTQTLGAEIGHQSIAADVQIALECAARGLTPPPTDSLVSEIRGVLSKAQDLKESKGRSASEHRNILGLNTEHLYFHVPLQMVLTCLEAARLNCFEAMTSTLATLRTSALYRVDGDPIGAANMEIRDILSVAIPDIRRGYLYLQHKMPGGTESRAVALPSGFVNEMFGWQHSDVPENLLFSPEDASRTRPDGSDTPLRVRADPTPTSQTGFEYQVFISFKNLDEAGHPTEDSLLAERLYRDLTARHLQVFFSNLSLERLGQSAYSKAIDDALDSSQIIVVVGTTPENLESSWVRYEWDSFFNDIISAIKPNGRVFVYVKGIAPRQLPRKLRQSQVFHHENDGASSLYNFIANALI